MVKLRAYARGELIDHAPVPAPGGRSAGSTRPDVALLLEGCWPSDSACAARQSLDTAIDGRFDWIDRRAAELAELLGGAGRPLDAIASAYLNVLALRYYLVKLIRPLAYLSEVQPLEPGDQLELVATRGRDHDYGDVLSQYCRAAGVHCRVRWVEGSAASAAGFPVDGRWRRWLARAIDHFQPTPDPCRPGRRAVLCGNPRLLDPVCGELLARGCRLWWLHDRFAVRSWLRWRAEGVRRLLCHSSLGRENRLTVDVRGRLECRGVNLAGPVRRWLSKRMATHGPRQTRLIEQIDAHFRRVRPEVLVLDEDATPLARAVVAVGRRHGARSLVVQHGVPYCRFGFAPPVADRILVWGRSSRQKLIAWGVPEGQIRVTGSPACDRLRTKLSSKPNNSRPRVDPRRRIGPPRILLLATVPPRDERPDAVALHLTGRTYAGMLRTALAAVAGIEGVELIVKLHPRSGDDPVVGTLLREFRSVDSRLVRRGSLQQWLQGVCCVLSCGSSAGVEATLAGVPVIQLAPPGATGFLAHDRWGLAGTARSESELRELLARTVAEGWRAPRVPDTDVLANFDRPAAARVADEVLAGEIESEGAVGGKRRIARRVTARQALPAGYCRSVREFSR